MTARCCRAVLATGARAKAWCLLIHAEASLSLFQLEKPKENGKGHKGGGGVSNTVGRASYNMANGGGGPRAGGSSSGRVS